MKEFEKHNTLVFKKVGKAINQFKMIENGDNVLIGLSGGKDSLVLADVLSKRKANIPIDYNLCAVHVDVKNMPYHSDMDYMNRFCKERNIQFIIKEIHVDFSLKPNKKPCFQCSWERRKELFEFAKTNNFNKIALGHNLDDALETLIINMLNHSNISSLPGKLSMFENKFQLIRPLLYLYNSDTKLYCKNNNLQVQTITCPYEDKTMREEASRLIESFSKLNKKAKENLFNSMSKIDIDYLPRIEGKKRIT